MLCAGAVVLGGEPPRPEIAKGPRGIEANFVELISKSEKPVRAVLFDATSATLIVTGVDGRIRILAVPSGKMIREFVHPGGATAFDQSPNGHEIATVGYDGTLRLWDLASGAARIVRVSAQSLWTVRFSLDGKLLAVAGEDKLIHLLTSDGMPIRTLAGHQRNIWDLAFSPDSRALASGSFDHALKIWDVASGHLLRTEVQHKQAIVALDIERKNGLIATGGDDATLRFWRPNGTLLRTLPAGQFVDAAAFSADGRWLISGGRESHGVNAIFKALFGRHLFGGSNPTARLWRVADGALVAELKYQPDDVVAVAFSPDGSWLATGSDDGSVALWRLSLAER
jgi:WD40 repeat protein